MTLGCQGLGYIHQIQVPAALTDCICVNADTTAADSANRFTPSIPTYTYSISRKNDANYQQIKKQGNRFGQQRTRHVERQRKSHVSTSANSAQTGRRWSAEKSRTTQLQPQQALSAYRASAHGVNRRFVSADTGSNTHMTVARRDKR